LTGIFRYTEANLGIGLGTHLFVKVLNRW